MPGRFLIAGLGNPGKRYAATRHNAGFMVVDWLAERHRLSFRAGKGDYLISEVMRAEGSEAELVLLKPLTFMNNSGMAVRSVVDYFNFDLERLLVVLDEFQLPFGKLRLRPNGSDGGHNGLSSVIQHLGTEGFARLRLGIGNEFSGDAGEFVLSEFSKSERELLPAIIEKAGEAIIDFAVHGVQHAMSRFN